MYKNKKILISLFTALLFSLSVFPAEPPPVGGDPTSDGSGATPVGGGAPIGSGLALVIGMGLAYGAKKTFQIFKEEE